MMIKKIGTTLKRIARIEIIYKLITDVTA
jgi:hypothetical protein